MVSVRALWFLTFRTWVNSVKRSIKMPRRLIGLIFFILLQCGFIGGRILGSGKTNLQDLRTLPKMDFTLPDDWLTWTQSAEFAMFAFLLLTLPGSWLALNGRFKKPDADVLFATPVSPKLLLAINLLRGKGQMVLYGVISLIVRAASGQGSGGQGDALHAIATGFFYLSVAGLIYGALFSGWSMAGQLYLGRDLPGIERLRKWVGRYVGYGVLTFFVSFFAYQFIRPPISMVKGVVDHPVLRAVMFPATFAGWTSNGVLGGQAWLFALGLLGLACVAAAGVWATMRQSNWLFDIAARSVAFGVVTNQDGGVTATEALAQHTAQKGRKHSKLRVKLRKLRMPGLAALAWRDLILNPWGSIIGYAFVFLTTTVIPFAAKLSTGGYGMHLAGSQLIPVLTPFVTLFMVGGGAHSSGIARMLMKGDIVRPLPFSSTQILFAEMGVRAVPMTAVLLLANLINVALTSYSLAIGALLFLLMPAVIFANLGIRAIVFMMLPDFTEVTQAGLRGMVMLLGTALINGPWLGLALLFGLVFHWSAPWIILPSVAINLVLGYATLRIAARLYENFNPSE